MGVKVKNIVYIALVLLVVQLLASPMSYGQNYGNNNNNNNNGNSNINDIYNNNIDNNNMGLSDNALDQPVDSLSKSKERKEKKPLTSYYFSDSTKLQNVFSWTHSTFNNNIEFISIDTMLSGFNRDYLFFNQEKIGSAYLGNLGGASVPLDYFNRRNHTSFSFLDAYQAYIYTPAEIPFYNTKRPFTQLSFFTSGQVAKAEEQLRVIHAQNISPSTSFNLEYRNNATRGMYNDQRSKDKNLSLAVDHTGNRYSVHSGYIYNMGDIQENGGVTNDSFVKDTLMDLPQNIPMNLKDAYNKFKGHTFFITQSYGLPFVSPKKKRIQELMLAGDSTAVLDEDVEYNLRDSPAIFFGQHFEFTSYKKTYTDTYEGVEEGYYDNWYINPAMSSDSIRERNIDARFFVQIQPYSRDGIISTLDGGIGYQNESYYYFQPKDYIYESENTVESSVYVYANAEGKFKKYINWDGHFKYHPLGANSQDMNFGGNLEFTAYLKDKPLKISAGANYSMTNTSFWSEHYYSNHFKWNNSFDKEIETRFEGKITMEDYGLELGAKQSIMTNKVYYNQNSLPTQFADALSLSSVYLQKDFRIGGLNLKNRVLLQWSSSQSVAPVPLVSANALYYYEFDVVKNVLRMQVGVDGYFNTSYYGFGYNPAIMQFYNQQTVKTGDYVWLDAFVSGKWKRLRFLIKLQHVNYELFGGRDYFQVAHYPLNRRMLKIGVSWNFYD